MSREKRLQRKLARHCRKMEEAKLALAKQGGLSDPTRTIRFPPKKKEDDENRPSPDQHNGR